MSISCTIMFAFVDYFGGEIVGAKLMITHRPQTLCPSIIPCRIESQRPFFGHSFAILFESMYWLTNGNILTLSSFCLLILQSTFPVMPMVQFQVRRAERTTQSTWIADYTCMVRYICSENSKFRCCYSASGGGITMN
jgi:hypothetical protein